MMANSASTPSCFLNNQIIRNPPADAKYTCYEILHLKSYPKNKWHFSYEKNINCLHKCFINLEITSIKSTGTSVL